jgi:hypothetical protein
MLTNCGISEKSETCLQGTRNASRFTTISNDLSPAPRPTKHNTMITGRAIAKRVIDIFTYTFLMLKQSSYFLHVSC